MIKGGRRERRKGGGGICAADAAAAVARQPTCGSTELTARASSCSPAVQPQPQQHTRDDEQQHDGAPTLLTAAGSRLQHTTQQQRVREAVEYSALCGYHTYCCRSHTGATHPPQQLLLTHAVNSTYHYSTYHLRWHRAAQGGREGKRGGRGGGGVSDNRSSIALTLTKSIGITYTRSKWQQQVAWSWLCVRVSSSRREGGKEEKMKGGKKRERGRQ